MAYFSVSCNVEGLGDFTIYVPDYSGFTDIFSGDIDVGYQSVVGEYPQFEPKTTMFYYGGTPRIQEYIKAVDWPPELSIDISKWIGKKILFSNGWSGIVEIGGPTTVPNTIGFGYNGVFIPLCREIVDSLNRIMSGMCWYFPTADYRPQFFRYSASVQMYQNNFSKMNFIFPFIDPQIAYEVKPQQAEFYNTIETSTDPFSPGGSSGPGGGTGDYDNTSFPVEIPSLPTLSATSTGFISLFNPSINQLSELSSYMWSDFFDVNTFKKLFADPMQTILGLSIVPGPIPSLGATEVKIGNISTGVSMNKAAQQYVTIDCGSLNVKEYWGSYLDYDPYTKFELYLPYIGTHAVSADDIVGKSITVVYHVDILSGGCVAYVKCGASVLYQFAGQCSASIPITGNDWTSVINGTLSVAASIGSMVATGGATAPLSASALANTVTNQLKPSIEKSGSISGSPGIMGIQRPYLIITRPRQALPSNQNTYIGYPSFYSVKLSDLKGYTEVEKIHLEGIPATEKELAEIDTLLKGGVIF